MKELQQIKINLHAQDDKTIKLTLWKGIVVAGYVDNGALVNFSGPSLSGLFKNHTL